MQDILKFNYMKKIIIIISIALFLTGCNALENETAVLWTNIPEMAAYVELFNAIQTEYRVELIYEENPAEKTKLFNNYEPDIVISKDLNSSKIIKKFSSLKRLVDKKRINPEIFYESLYKLGFYEDEPHLLPVSFNVPAIIYQSNSKIVNNSEITFTPEMLQKEGFTFNSDHSNGKKGLGFSALWEPSFIIDFAFLKGAGFSELPNGELIWNNTKLNEAIDVCKKYSEINSGFEKEKDFTMTYCYDPGYKLINSGRIAFYYSSLREYYKIPSSERSLLSLKWFGSENSIPVKEDIIFAGIPSQSKKQKTAQKFFLWFFNLDSQKKIIESAKFKRLQGFGICDGFSSIIDVNELVVPTYYRNLVGNLPPKDYLSFPGSLPLDWDAMKDEAIIPWLKSRFSDNPQEEDLSDVLKTWTMQQQKIR